MVLVLSFVLKCMVKCLKLNSSPFRVHLTPTPSRRKTSWRESPSPTVKHVCFLTKQINLKKFQSGVLLIFCEGVLTSFTHLTRRYMLLFGWGNHERLQKYKVLSAVVHTELGG